ncbi:hypothetical protein TVAG_397450 [Trichomonas vaginalis G3]|uniref:Leucine Rich Repeat family protein n=1 Tax=Trichomonas vaginalis (strain ATCC PRA-98 / G3) TaxID=412133 RepID=A2G1C2_TRIV3|nr:leucine-rich repeat, isoform f-related family [Trichomonas vaginalis G3]EAX89038.1 hypothetical protein TVAG_397450 [Trichomonas vaginalis G3]KAI5513148.1 leucine-rich repeat, isoform f-related family [Trichomonas vaginalis G3]|eukprot:XP_001301968.1 hypothetical protein [Trichomonas vaginalis G3]
MSHCLSETDSSLYQFFSCFSNMKNLSHLILKGDKNFHLGKTVEMLFKTLETSGKSLDYLDISNSFCGDEGIEMISKFLNSNFSPKIFVFDGTKPTNLEPFLSLLLGYLNSNCASSVSFPLSDLEKLKNDGKIKMQQFNEILDLFRTSEGDGGSAFDSLFFIYYEDERFDEKFPRYVNASYLTESKQDKNTPKRLFEMSKNQNYQTKPKNTSVTVSISRSQPKFDKISDFTSMASESTFAPSSRAVGAPTVAFSVSNNSTNIGDVDQNKTLSDNEQNQIHEPLKPPPEKGGSPRRSIRHVSTANVEFRLDITSSSSSASSPKNLRNSKSMNSNVLLAKNGDDSDALVTKDFDISTSDDDDFREEVVTKESRHLRQTLMNSRYQKKELDDDFDWKFPLERVETMYKGSWAQSQQRFSIVESMKFLSKIPHNHYPN